VNHYENFPVASRLCPPELRPAVVAIYRFARTADDIADEGNATPAVRLADLSAYRADLQAIARGEAESSRWADVFVPLKVALNRHNLPVPLLTDLLSAFEQDVRKSRYADRPELLDYCRRSANPIGRLMLHLYGVTNADALLRSDAICTALQLTNFWQDLGVDIRRGRHYMPQSDCARHGITESECAAHSDTVSSRAAVRELVQWTRTMFDRGSPLVHKVAGRAGWELRLVVQGGLRILDKIDRLDGATISTRPKLGPVDLPRMVWRSLWMTNTRGATATELQ
jgi:squalene synthase HpnC